MHSTWLDDSKQHAVTAGAWDFKEGEQLFEPYGQPNHIYFTYHGFVLDHNAHDCVKMDLKVDPADERRDEKKRALRRALRSSSFCVSPRKITQSLLEFMRIVHDAPDRAAQRAALATVCKNRLAAYPTTVTEDERLLAKGQGGQDMSYKRLTAIKFRLSEKRILQEVVASLGVNGKGEL